jgi:mono/diheme cytochrome c family protein
MQQGFFAGREQSNRQFRLRNIAMMTKSIRSQVGLALVLALASSVSFAESGAAIYKANCQSCHGSSGTPSPGIAKMMGVKPASEYKSSEKEQIEAVKNGKNKMKAFASKLTDDQIKDAVTYFRSLK